MVVQLLLLATACVAQPAWTRQDLPGITWKEKTRVVVVGERVLLLHGRHASRLHADGRIETWRYALPLTITPLVSAVDADQDSFWMVGGPSGKTFRVNVHNWHVEHQAFLGAAGAGVAACRFRNHLWAARGDGSGYWAQLVDGKWEPRPPLVIVNPLGKFSSGLHPAGDGIAAFGDHHVAWFDMAKQAWRAKADVHIVMRVRPAIGRGGMSTWDRAKDQVFVTLGKSSRSLGILQLNQRRYFHLRPRLPIALRESGETLYVDGKGGDRRLVLVSIENEARFSIPVRDLVRIGAKDQKADGATEWEVWNSAPYGADGELIRERDGFSNMLVVGRQMYTQRKNVVRRWHLDRRLHSKNSAGHHYGSEWITLGAAAAADPTGRIFLCTGHDRRIWALHTARRLDGKPVADAGAPDIEEMAVSELPELPEDTGGNTSLAWTKAGLVAVLSQKSRGLHRLDEGAGKWAQLDALPPALNYDAKYDLDVHADGDALVVVSGDHCARRDVKGVWTVLDKLPFRATTDGGMSVLDPVRRKIYVVVGGGSRDLGVIDLNTGTAELQVAALPDAVSVHGHRIWVDQVGDDRWLYVYRGHDSDELWRLRLPKP
ncbi:MAG: hypothetical protein CMJ83_01905 [Planctomycetes bacterium]|nr:hypothetical protein [Planctomycetota bacterium]